nr:proline-rich protein 36-like isoform X3 [Procambarus clarkii]
MTNENIKWLRPATPLEELFEARNRQGTFLSVYVMKLGSAAPLEPHTVKQALLHLYRKVPNLRACFGSFEDQTWFKESTNDNIDFKVVTDEDMEGVMTSLRTCHYKSFEGPLWCARFLPDASPEVPAASPEGPDASPEEPATGPDASPEGPDASPEGHAAGPDASPEGPAAGPGASPEGPAAGPDASPEGPAAGPDASPEGPDASPEGPAAGPDASPEGPATKPVAGPDASPEGPAAGPDASPERPAAGPDASPEGPDASPEGPAAGPDASPERPAAGLDASPEGPDASPEGPDASPEGHAAGPDASPEGPAAGPDASPEGPDASPEGPAAGPDASPEGPDASPEGLVAGPDASPEGPAAGPDASPERPAAGPDASPEGHAAGPDASPEGPAAGPDASPEGPDASPEGPAAGPDASLEGPDASPEGPATKPVAGPDASPEGPATKPAAGPDASPEGPAAGPDASPEGPDASPEGPAAGPDASPEGPAAGPDASPEGPDASPEGPAASSSLSSQDSNSTLPSRSLNTSLTPAPLTGINGTSCPTFTATLILVSGSSSPDLPTAGSLKVSPPAARYTSSAPVSPLCGLSPFSPTSLGSARRSPSGASEASSWSSHVEERSSLPYTSHLALGLHNSVADGFTAMKICGFIVKLLNDVIAGTPIDEQQLGEFATWETSWMAWGIKEVKDGDDTLLIQTLKEELKAKKKCKSEVKALFRVPEDPEGKACHITRTLDLASTKNFLEKCHSQGVRLHSVFCALANVAFVDLLVERDVVRNSSVICSSHYSNLRRYWKSDSSLGLGCNIAPFHLCVDTKSDETRDFWSYVRSFQENLEKALDHATMRRESSAFQIFVPEVLDHRQVLLEPWPFETDYYTSNMGDVTALVTEGGPHVYPEHLVSSTSINKLSFGFSHVFHTFRGRFIHTLDYNTQLVTETVAEEYCNRLFKKLHEVING